MYVHHIEEALKVIYSFTGSVYCQDLVNVAVDMDNARYWARLVIVVQNCSAKRKLLLGIIHSQEGYIPRPISGIYTCTCLCILDIYKYKSFGLSRKPSGKRIIFWNCGVFLFSIFLYLFFCLFYFFSSKYYC